MEVIILSISSILLIMCIIFFFACIIGDVILSVHIKNLTLDPIVEKHLLDALEGGELDKYLSEYSTKTEFEQKEAHAIKNRNKILKEIDVSEQYLIERYKTDALRIIADDIIKKSTESTYLITVTYNSITIHTKQTKQVIYYNSEAFSIKHNINYIYIPNTCDLYFFCIALCDLLNKCYSVKEVYKTSLEEEKYFFNEYTYNRIKTDVIACNMYPTKSPAHRAGDSHYYSFISPLPTLSPLLLSHSQPSPPSHQCNPQEAAHALQSHLPTASLRDVLQQKLCNNPQKVK